MDLLLVKDFLLVLDLMEATIVLVMDLMEATIVLVMDLMEATTPLHFVLVIFLTLLTRLVYLVFRSLLTRVVFFVLVFLLQLDDGLLIKFDFKLLVIPYSNKG